jgi:3D (Asp-Asp-Asp) domain-containing protein
MNKFVRGGFILAIVSMCVVFIYASTSTDKILSSTNGSKDQFENNAIGSNIEAKAILEEEVLQTFIQDQDKAKKPVQDQDKNKKIVEKTVSSRSTAGASKGSFTATAYCLKGRTAMGHGVRRGIIAADPRVLKLGSRINLGAGAYSGEYLVSDTGGAVKGKKIDIWMPSCAEARRFGRRTVSISAL